MDTVRDYQLSEQPLGDLLKAFEVTRESVKLRVQADGGEGEIAVMGGRLIGASFGNRTGEEAALELLGLRTGRIEVSARGVLGNASKNATMQGVGAGAPLGNLAKRAAAPASRPQLEARLMRSGQPPEDDLDALGQRILAQVDGNRSALALLRELDAPADQVLASVRRLFRAGYLMESRKRTIALGAPTGTSPAERGAAVAQSNQAPQSNQAAEPAQKDAAADAPPSEPAKGTWAANAQRRAEQRVSSRYSSVPPRKLAEERLSVPSTMQHVSVPPAPAAGVDASGASPGPAARRVLPAQATHPAEGSAVGAWETTSLGRDEDVDDVLAAARVQLRESEFPVPGDELDPHALEQLGVLDESVKSSHRNDIPLDFAGSMLPASSERSTAPATSSSPGWIPPSSIDGAPPPDELPPPGSVPRSQELPGGSRGQAQDGKRLPTVGRYEVLARLKRGGMGSVYMCRLSGNAGFRRLFAMKVLHGHLAEQPGAIDEFFHEARVLGSLHHPNIVSIIDVGTPKEPYLVMDYVEGGSLAELFRATKEGRDPALVIPLILDALSGISCAHHSQDSSGQPLELVHCDLSPHNLLVGIDGSCRVTDFGIAVTKQAPASADVLRGKPGYVSPERLERQEFDARADVFALGVVLYLGLTGVHPFGAEEVEPASVLRRMLGGDIQPPSEVGFRPPPALDWVCMKALSRRPEERFQDADEMSHHLRRIATRDDLVRPPGDVARWVRKTLAPALAARRAASLRGTDPTRGLEPFSLTTAPPPVAEPKESKTQPSQSAEAHPEAPSALEHTGPLDPPPSSHAFNDRTEVLHRDPAARSKTKQRLTWLLAAAAAGLVIWGLLAPRSLQSLFVMEPAGDAVRAPSQPGADALDAPLEETPNDPESGAINLPPIETGHSQSPE